jgi:hypothetical protein
MEADAAVASDPPSSQDIAAIQDEDVLNKMVRQYKPM